MFKNNNKKNQVNSPFKLFELFFWLLKLHLKMYILSLDIYTIPIPHVFLSIIFGTVTLLGRLSENNC